MVEADDEEGITPVLRLQDADPPPSGMVACGHNAVDAGIGGLGLSSGARAVGQPHASISITTNPAA